MSKTSAIQRINVFREWLQQLDRESRTNGRHRKTVKRKEEEESPPVVPKEE